MNSFVGADVEQLLSLAQRLEFRSRKFSEIASSSTAALMVAAWTGANIDRVRDEWNRQSKPTITRVSQSLVQLSIDLRKQAEQQRAASGAASGGNGVREQHSAHPLGDPAPTTTAQRWDLVRDAGEDGVRIQGIRGEDGVVRYVVYIDGTDPSSPGHRGVLENRAQLGFGTGTEDYILAAMRDQIPAGAEVMVMGYSQGGIHAQAIAATNEFNVTDVVTFGSPYRADVDIPGGPNFVRIQDVGDRIPDLDVGRRGGDVIAETADKAWTAWRSIFGDDAGAVQHEVDRLNRGADITYVVQARDVDYEFMIGSHTDSDTYRQGADQFEEMAAGRPEGRVALESQGRYQGQVISDTDTGVRINYDNVAGQGSVA